MFMGFMLLTMKKNRPMNNKMTVKQVVEALECPERTVRDSVNRVIPGKAKKGIKTLLNEKEVSLVSADLKRAHNVVATTRHDAITDIEMKEKTIEVLSWLQTEVKIERELRIAAENREQKLIPKAEFFDAVTDSRDTLEMGAVAKLLGTGRNRLFEFLRSIGVLMHNNHPYQKYIDRGYFRVIEQAYEKPDGVTGINTKTLVYQRGVDYISKKIKE